MDQQITIPDLRFEETFTQKLKASAKLARSNAELSQAIISDNGTDIDNDIPTPIIIKALLVDQIIMPFVQSFALTSVLYFVRPVLALVTNHGVHAGSSLITSVKTILSTFTRKQRSI